MADHLKKEDGDALLQEDGSYFNLEYVPDFVASTSASLTTAGTGPLTVNKPTGTTNGDLLVAHIAMAGATTITAPSGWKLLHRGTSGIGGGALYVKLASGEGASWDWNFGSSIEANVIVHAYRPSSGGAWASAGAAIASVEWLSNASGTTPTVPSILLPVSNLNMMLVTFMSLARGSTTTTKPTNYTLAENPDSGGTTSGATESAGAYLKVASGTVASTNWTVTNSATSQTYMLALIDPATTRPTMIRTHQTPAFGTASSFSIDLPLAEAGDLILMVFSTADSGTPSGITGYTTGGGTITDTGTDQILVRYKVSDGTETTITQFLSTSAPYAAVVMVMYGVSSKLALSVNHDAVSDTTWTVTSLTAPAPVAPNGVDIIAETTERGDRTASAVNGAFTFAENVRSGTASGDSSMAWAYQYHTGADPAGADFTGSAASRNAGLHAAWGRGGARSWAVMMD